MKGRLQGQGAIHFGNGDLYEGELKDGMRSGKGVMTYQLALPGDSARYEGHWKRNMRHGYGEIKWSDGSEFKG